MLFYWKEIPAYLLSFEFCEVFQNSFFSQNTWKWVISQYLLTNTLHFNFHHYLCKYFSLILLQSKIDFDVAFLKLTKMCNCDCWIVDHFSCELLDEYCLKSAYIRSFSGTDILRILSELAKKRTKQWCIRRFFGNTVFSIGFQGRSPKEHNRELWRIIFSYKHK